MSSTSAPPPIPSSNNGVYVLLGVLLMGGTGAIIYFKFLRAEPLTVAQVLPPPPSGRASAQARDNPVMDDVPLPPPVAEKPTGGGTAGVRPAGSAGSPVTAAPSVGGCEGKCTGTDTPELANAVRGRIGAARQCYQRALGDDATLKGTVGIALRVGPGGSVCSASMTSTTLNSPGVEQCALNALRAATYPAPSGGCKDVAATINFAPGK